MGCERDLCHSGTLREGGQTIIVRSHFGSCQGKQLGMFGFGQGCLAGSSRCILCPGQLLALGALQGLWLRTLVVRVVVELGG